MAPAEFAERSGHLSERDNVDKASARSEQVAVASPLVVGAAYDQAEVEADRVAGEVVARLGADLHQHSPACGHVSRSAAPIGGAEVGLAGGPLSSGVADRIEARRGGGTALPGPVRERMESGFGGSLAHVRVHDDAESAALNRTVSARAFTTGNDIFFGSGEFRPGTPEGDHVLAHEIAHTRQQGPGAARIHRYKFEGTDWSKTKTVNVFKGGGSGKVAEYDDGSGKPLIVKVDQLIGNEVAVAGALHAATAKKSGGSGGFEVSSPGVRLALPDERTDLEDLANTKRIDDDARHFLEGFASTNPILIMQKSGGEDFKKILEKGSQTTDVEEAEPDPKSILFKMLQDKGPVTTLAQQVPTDVFMGMHDRLVGSFNSENFKYDEKKKDFGFIDNTHNQGAGYLVSNDIITSKDAFGDWVQHRFTKLLAVDQAGLAGEVFEAVFGSSGIPWDLRKRPEALELYNSALEANKTKIAGWIEAGITRGMKSLLAVLAKPLPLVAGVSEDLKQEALQSIRARHLVLLGSDPAEAWDAAGEFAASLLAPKKPKTKTKAPKPKSEKVGKTVDLPSFDDEPSDTTGLPV